MKKFTTCLWFDRDVEEAANYYASIFADVKIGRKLYWGKENPALEGTLLTIEWEMNGMQFMGLNGRPNSNFNDSISFVIHCDTQEQIDFYWEKLTADGGSEVQCGWLRDKYGVSWQVVSDEFLEILQNPDKAKAERAMRAMMEMVKLDIKKLKQAAEG